MKLERNIFKLFLLFALTISCNYLFSQKDSSFFKNRIILELGGPCGHYSAIYERRVYERKNKFLSLAISLAPTLLKSNDYNSSNFTPRLSFQIKDHLKFKKSYFEYGIALTNYYYSNKPFNLNVNNIYIAILPIIGFSRDFTAKFNLGLYFTPLIYDEGYDFYYWGAIRLGYRLN